MAKNKKTKNRSDTDMAGYDHSQERGKMRPSHIQNYAQSADQRSGTYRDRDHDGGWSSQVGMDRYEDRSGGESYDRMSRGIHEQSYGRGPAQDHGSPFSRGAGYGGGGDLRQRQAPVSQRDIDNDRGMMARAGDEVLSWFGDEEAERRREEDHRGKGPKGYKRSDQRVLEDVNDRLFDDSRVDASDITVAMQDGEVTLSGTVQSKFAKRRAEDCVDAVSGVQHVQNNLRVAAGAADVTRA
jgi:osmotically-inducible protein OsmY